MNWIDTTIGDYCPFTYGKALPKTKRIAGPFPVYGSNGCVDYHIEELINSPGIIVGRKGSCGAVHLSDKPFWPIDTSFYLVKESLNELRFIYYLLKTLGLEDMNSDSAVPGLNRENAHSLKIRIPEKKEDRERLGYTISVFDQKIAVNNLMNSTLEKISQRIYKSWFVDFAPVKAKTSGSTLNDLSSEVQSLFPDKFEESDLGLIPKGWKPSTVGQEFDVVMGQSPPGSSYNETGEGVLFFQGRRDFGFRYPSERVFTSIPKRFAKAGDTLLSVRAPVGDVNKALKSCCIGRGVAALRHKSGSESFTYYTAHRLKSVFDSYDGEGTVFGSINQAELKALSVISPSEPVVKKFNEVVSPFDDAIKNNTEQNISLAKIRDRLLPRLISGKLKISEAEKLIGETT